MNKCELASKRLLRRTYAITCPFCPFCGKEEHSSPSDSEPTFFEKINTVTGSEKSEVHYIQTFHCDECKKEFIVDYLQIFIPIGISERRE